MTECIRFYRKHSSKNKLILLGSALLIITSYLDLITPYEVRFTVLYLAAIFLMTIAVSRRVRNLIALATIIISLYVDILNKPTNMTHAIFIWNSIMRLILYIGLPQLLSAYIDSVEREAFFALRDPLTGLYNRKAFYELCEVELQTSRRYNHVFSVAFIDCDNFKYVNDTFGHAVGDILLKTISDILKTTLRSTDITTRIGGDEFIVFFPETPEVCKVVEKIEKDLKNSMKRNGWPVTFSIGVAIFSNHPTNLDEIITKADNLMYEVKNGGKNGIRYHTF